MDIAQHSDQPVSIEIGGRTYGFSEIKLRAIGELQQWIKNHVPHPLFSIKDQLGGFSAEDRAVLLNEARKDALRWPPEIGTAQGSAALLATESGQTEAMWVALKVHQPETTQEEGRALYKQARRQAIKDTAEGRTSTLDRIFAIAFGMEELLDDGPTDRNGLPKA